MSLLSSPFPLLKERILIVKNNSITNKISNNSAPLKNIKIINTMTIIPLIPHIIFEIDFLKEFEMPMILKTKAINKNVTIKTKN